MANTTGRKHGGRKKGTPNKDTAALRKRISKLLDDNWVKIEEDMAELSAKERLDICTRLLEYALPKLSRVEVEREQEIKSKLSTEDLNKLTVEECETLDRLWAKVNSDAFDPITIFQLPNYPDIGDRK